MAIGVIKKEKRNFVLRVKDGDETGDLMQK
jgi:hypothetical protein